MHKTCEVVVMSDWNSKIKIMCYTRRISNVPENQSQPSTTSYNLPPITSGRHSAGAFSNDSNFDCLYEWGSAQYLYLRGTFSNINEHSWLRYWISLVSSGKCRDITLEYAATASFQILPRLSFMMIWARACYIGNTLHLYSRGIQFGFQPVYLPVCVALISLSIRTLLCHRDIYSYHFLQSS
jgi:hypothetical protein